MRKPFIILFTLICFGCMRKPIINQEIPRPKLIVIDMVYGQVKESNIISSDFFAKYNGELLLYDSIIAENYQLIYPYCISANSHVLSETEKRAYDRKWVHVTGIFVKEDQYDDPPDAIRTMGSAEGLPFPNQCWSPFMLRIDKIELIIESNK